MNEQLQAIGQIADPEVKAKALKAWTRLAAMIVGKTDPRVTNLEASVKVDTRALELIATGHYKDAGLRELREVARKELGL